MKKLVSVLSVLFMSSFLVVASGCSATGSVVPAKKYIVGGGFAFSYTAQVDGTAMLIDGNRGQVLASETVTSGNTFSADPDEVITMIKDCGMAPANINPVLYFVPTPVVAESAK